MGWHSMFTNWKIFNVMTVALCSAQSTDETVSISKSQQAFLQRLSWLTIHLILQVTNNSQKNSENEQSWKTHTS